MKDLNTKLQIDNAYRKYYEVERSQPRDLGEALNKQRILGEINLTIQTLKKGTA